MIVFSDRLLRNLAKISISIGIRPAGVGLLTDLGDAPKRRASFVSGTAT
jgi:hypothetical protein